MKSVLAIDLGATSGRAVSYYIVEGTLFSEEILRFENVPIKERGVLAWDIHLLFSNILQAIQLASEKGELLSLGIDTWGVDFALIDGEGQLVAASAHYRDKRTKGVLEEVSQCSSLTDLYFKTGNQLMEINTLFQLIRTRTKNPDSFFLAKNLLMIPDYLNYLLTGQKAIERSIASTMQLVNPYTQTWSQDILEMFEIPETLLPELVQEGNILGELSSKYKLGNPKVINVCEHDTASAIAAIPVEDDKTLFISSGTWSLIGTELNTPIINERTLNYNFTNEAGHSGTTTFLKNCTGLWIVEELRREFEHLGQPFDFDTIAKLVAEVDRPTAIIDTDSPEFAEPDQMIEKLKEYAQKTKQPIPESPGELFKVAYTSLASKYKEVIGQLEEILAERFEKIHVIGGGSKSTYFSQLIADTTGKTVVTGLSEATSVGNALIQLVALGELTSIQEGRQLVRQTFDCKQYYPQKNKEMGDDKLS
ncbi:L-fuculose kinase fucK [Streptococcus varani]|uniref:L-fuculose kinase fucK n=1 Tax=Streptococcus varani TaxID=1608583 RepID=A0A0E4H816_9STRE|nr:rhamnulokinase family protein [Streptococcus varani]CQR24970.1 L-fuculose kinase fucK [Streptococcus varani]